MKKTQYPARSQADQTFIYSWSAIREYMRHKPLAIKAIECKDSWREKTVAALKNSGLSEQLLRRPGPTDDFKDSPVRARIVANCLDEDSFLQALQKGAESLVLALDHITDPRNLGAIVRSAAFFGIKSVVIPERRQAAITEAALNTAQGGFALVEVVQVVNLGRALEKLKEQGFWVVGTAMDGESIDEVAGFYDKTVLVLGSEDKGMGAKISEKCDRIVRLGPTHPPLDSLNVSVAAGIAIHEFSKQRKVP